MSNIINDDIATLSNFPLTGMHRQQMIGSSIPYRAAQQTDQKFTFAVLPMKTAS
jgi:hypothetical protein